MTEEERLKDNRRLFEEYSSEINTRILSNIENHDKAILSLSTAILGVSLAFVKDIVPIEELVEISILQLSWVVLILSILSVLISFQTANKANNKHLEYAEDFYIKDNDEAFKNKSIWFSMTELLNMMSGIFFIVGIILTSYFVSANISNKGTLMSDKHMDRGANPPKVKPKTGQSK